MTNRQVTSERPHPYIRSNNPMQFGVTAGLVGKRLKPDAESGTVAYLEQIAIQEPASFCSLLGKVLPMTIADTGRTRKPEWWSGVSLSGPRTRMATSSGPSGRRTKAGARYQ